MLVLSGLEATVVSIAGSVYRAPQEAGPSSPGRCRGCHRCFHPKRPEGFPSQQGYVAGSLIGGYVDRGGIAWLRIQQALPSHARRSKVTSLGRFQVEKRKSPHPDTRTRLAIAEEVRT